MAIYSGFSHEKWWIFPVRYVNVYQRVCQQFAIENGPIEISLMYPFNSMVDLSIVEHGFQLVGVFSIYWEFQKIPTDELHHFSEG